MKRFRFILVIFLLFFGMADEVRPPQIVRQNLVKITYDYNEAKVTCGSGTIINQKYILSCYHLIKDRPKGKLYITTYDKKVQEASIIKFDADNDLLLLTLEKPVSWLTATIASEMIWGEKIYFGGYPDMKLPLVRIDFLEIGEEGICLHPIYFGDSGGGVFNERQELIGVISKIYVAGSKKTTIKLPTLVGYATSLETIQRFMSNVLDFSEN